MTGPDLLAEAVAELYAADPDAFTERRGVLAAQARAAGDAAAAKKIAGLRKPTRTAWIINQLIRADLSVPARLTELGDELRAAQAALDGVKIRELSLARRELMDALIRQTLQLPGQPAPTAALREELTATFGAALADPLVARDLAAGTLLRAVHRADFSPGGPGLILVPPPADAPTGPAAAPARPAARPGARPAAASAKAPSRPPAAPAPAKSPSKPAAALAPAKSAAAAAAARDRAAAKLAAESAAAAAAERAERERRRAIADAEQAEAGARQAADAAAKAEDEQQQAVRLLEDQLADTRQRLADARQRLAEARLRARKAESAQRRARQALSRFRD
jgi:hypothetical protein